VDNNAEIALCIGIAVIYAMMVTTIVGAFIAMRRSGEFH
jgi:hypothetical protein